MDKILELVISFLNEHLKKYWFESWVAIPILLLLSFGLALPFLLFMKSEAISSEYFLATGFLAVILISIRWASIKLPQNTKGLIGIVISISVDNESGQSFKSALEKSLIKQISLGKGIYKYKLVFLNKYHSSIFNFCSNEERTKLVNKMKAHCAIYVDCNCGNIDKDRKSVV